MDPEYEHDQPLSSLQNVSSFANPLSPSIPAPSIEISRPDDKPRSGLLESIQLGDASSYRPTPEITNGFERQLNLTSSEETDEDSLEAVSESSIEDETIEAPPFGLPKSDLSTGLCYDERMRFHSEVSAPTGESVHPEDPRRIYFIFKELCDAGLAHDGTKKFRPLVPKPLKRIPIRQVTKEEVCLVHTEEHWNFVESTAAMSNEQLIDLSEAKDMDSIYFNQFSSFSAKFSAGGAIETCKAVVKQEVRNAIAVIRPPGHHAEINRTMGFCLFNNVCIASRVCQEDFGKGCRKILILDWDVHHGNGCQKAFYDNPNILYISIHVHMNGNFYPSGDEGDMFHVGYGAGTGYNINIPWPTKGMGDADYMYAFQNLVMPVAIEFDPDLVIVAAGFDAAAGDELGGCFVSPACYAHMTHMLMSLADGKVAVCLEGGYNLTSISKSALAVTKTLMGEPPDRLMQTSATTSAVETVQQVRNIHSRYWGSIYPKEPLGGIFGGDRLHDIIREWQAKQLYDNFKLTQLKIYRDNVSKSFENQVLASPDFFEKKRLFVIFHDPPEAMKSPNTLSSEMKLHETWLIDATKTFISRALSAGFGVLDINLPSHITNPDPPYNVVKYNQQDDDLGRKNGERLARYIWENYIEPYDFELGIVLCGVGDSFHAVQRLLTDLDPSRFIPQRVSSETQMTGSSGGPPDSSHSVSYNSSGESVGGVRAVLGFIAHQPVRPVTIQPVSPTATSSLPYQASHLDFGVTEEGRAINESNWYREHSRIYVSPSHMFWRMLRENPKKMMSRRYGNVLRADSTFLSGMMEERGREAWTWIMSKVGRDDQDDMDDEVEEDEDEDEEDETEEDDDDQGGRSHTITVATEDGGGMMTMMMDTTEDGVHVGPARGHLEGSAPVPLSPPATRSEMIE